MEKNKLFENANLADKIYVTPLTAEAKDLIEALGYNRSGVVYRMRVRDLKKILETVSLDIEDLSVKDEDGEEIEDLYGLAFESDADYDFNEEDGPLCGYDLFGPDWKDFMEGIYNKANSKKYIRETNTKENSSKTTDSENDDEYTDPEDRIIDDIDYEDEWR